MESESKEQRRGRRPKCPNCNRPQTVCLCHVIPSPPIQTKTQIIIIQHPHETRHKLNTIPLLTQSLQNVTVYSTRRITPTTLPSSQSQSYFYLFPPSPTSPALPLSKLPQLQSPVVLVVFDATWKHAKEMVKASEGYLGKRVCLDGYNRDVEGGSIYDSDLFLRKEPCEGCVSTLEAVARWLAKVEDNGLEIQAQLLSVLREMVRLQAQFIPNFNIQSSSSS